MRSNRKFADKTRVQIACAAMSSVLFFGLSGCGGGTTLADSESSDANTADALSGYSELSFESREQALAVTLPPQVPENPFGVASSASSSQTLSRWVTAVAEAGVGTVRGFDRNANFSGITPIVNAGMAVTGIYRYQPVDNVPAWTNYVTNLTTVFKGRVKEWEVWNEPPNFTPNTPPQDYGVMVAHAYTAAKAVDPTVKVGLAAQSVNLNYLDQALVAGANGHFDYVTVHPYEVASLVSRGHEAQYMSIVPTIRKMLAARSPAQAKAPVIFSEVGQPVDATHTAEQQADLLVKLYTMGIAQGVQRTHWFEPLDGDSGPFGLIASDGSKRPSFKALETLVAYLGERPRYHGWLLFKSKHYAFVFSGPRGMVMVTWGQPGSSEWAGFDQKMTIVYPRTGTSRSGVSLTLTNAPVLIVSSADVPAWANAAQANLAKPFPWGGDYSKSTAVSITAPSTDRGLHQTVTPPTRKIGSETVRDASTASAQKFVVDPNFLSYTPAKIRVTAVVRRNGSANAGFNVKYEGATGWRSLPGWKSVPSNTEWTTMSWDISDPQFVGKWGYHFALDSDSTTHSGYSIRSITVSKLP